jgi:hypothetical protein
VHVQQDSTAASSFIKVTKATGARPDAHSLCNDRNREPADHATMPANPNTCVNMPALRRICRAHNPNQVNSLRWNANKPGREAATAAWQQHSLAAGPNPLSAAPHNTHHLDTALKVKSSMTDGPVIG